MSEKLISNIEQARNCAHAGDVENMCVHLDEARDLNEKASKNESCEDNLAKMIEIVEKCGNAISFHHKMLDDINKKFIGKEKDHATMAVKYAKYGLLDLMSKQIGKSHSLILEKSCEKSDIKENIDFIEITGHNIASYRDLITAIVHVAKNNKQIAKDFLETAKQSAKKSGVDIKEEVKMIEKIMK